MAAPPASLAQLLKVSLTITVDGADDLKPTSTTPTGLRRSLTTPAGAIHGAPPRSPASAKRWPPSPTRAKQLVRRRAPGRSVISSAMRNRVLHMQLVDEASSAFARLNAMPLEPRPSTAPPVERPRPTVFALGRPAEQPTRRPRPGEPFCITPQMVSDWEHADALERAQLDEARAEAEAARARARAAAGARPAPSQDSAVSRGGRAARGARPRALGEDAHLGKALLDADLHLSAGRHFLETLARRPGAGTDSSAPLCAGFNSALAHIRQAGRLGELPQPPPPRPLGVRQPPPSPLSPPRRSASLPSPSPSPLSPPPPSLPPPSGSSPPPQAAAAAAAAATAAQGSRSTLLRLEARAEHAARARIASALWICRAAEPLPLLHAPPPPKKRMAATDRERQAFAALLVGRGALLSALYEACGRLTRARLLRGLVDAPRGPKMEAGAGAARARSPAAAPRVRRKSSFAPAPASVDARCACAAELTAARAPPLRRLPSTEAWLRPVSAAGLRRLPSTEAWLRPVSAAGLRRAASGGATQPRPPIHSPGARRRLAAAEGAGARPALALAVAREAATRASALELRAHALPAARLALVSRGAFGEFVLRAGLALPAVVAPAEAGGEVEAEGEASSAEAQLAAADAAFDSVTAARLGREPPSSLARPPPPAEAEAAAAASRLGFAGEVLLFDEWLLALCRLASARFAAVPVAHLSERLDESLLACARPWLRGGRAHMRTADVRAGALGGALERHAGLLHALFAVYASASAARLRAERAAPAPAPGGEGGEMAAEGGDAARLHLFEWLAFWADAGLLATPAVPAQRAATAAAEGAAEIASAPPRRPVRLSLNQPLEQPVDGPPSAPATPAAGYTALQLQASLFAAAAQPLAEEADGARAIDLSVCAADFGHAIARVVDSEMRAEDGTPTLEQGTEPDARSLARRVDALIQRRLLGVWASSAVIECSTAHAPDHALVLNAKQVALKQRYPAARG
jgi:hypothetical protein